MKKLALPLLLGILASIACIYFAGFSTNPTAILEPDNLGLEAHDNRSNERGSEGQRQRSPGDDDRNAASTDPVRRRPGLRTLTVTGRCLAKASGMPIEGCAVEVIARPQGFARAEVGRRRCQ